MARSAAGLAPEPLLSLFEAALAALWNRIKTTLGEVTLTAIAERVLYDATEKFPFFSSLKVEPAQGFQCRELGRRVGSMQGSELSEAIRFVLVEFLTVLGRLTAEILTPELHAELSRIATKTSGARATPAGAARHSRRRHKEGTR